MLDHIHVGVGDDGAQDRQRKHSDHHQSPYGVLRSRTSAQKKHECAGHRGEGHRAHGSIG
jgi:hypothetical protein